MRVSIAMTTFNGAEHLQEQLDSFLHQSRLPDELVVCDDGSTDETVEILSAFKEQAPFIVQVVVNSRNLGFTKNFEKAMRLCSGDVIFLSDQDDVWYSTKIATILAALESDTSAMLIVHDGKLVDSNLVWLGATKLGQVMRGFGSPASLVMGGLTAYTARLGRLALPIPDGMAGHDQWLHLIARHLGSRRVVPDVLQLIRRHENNTSSWIASSPLPISKWDVFRAQWKSPIAAGYDDRLLINGAATNCLEALLEEPSWDDSRDRIVGAVLRLKEERRALLARQALAGQGWVARKATALRMYLRGDYAHFNGYKSLFRDLAR